MQFWKSDRLEGITENVGLYGSVLQMGSLEYLCHYNISFA